MGLFRRLFARSEPPCADLRVEGPGEFATDVVGESRYQDALEEIAGGRSEDGYNLVVEAVLVLEDSNPHDSEAVQVVIHGQTCGYLTRRHAGLYRGHLKKMGRRRATVACPARIVGGWDRGPGDRGHFGVQLNLPPGLAGRAEIPGRRRHRSGQRISGCLPLVLFGALALSCGGFAWVLWPTPRGQSRSPASARSSGPPPAPRQPALASASADDRGAERPSPSPVVEPEAASPAEEDPSPEPGIDLAALPFRLTLLEVAAAFEVAQAEAGVIRFVDARQPEAYALGHIPGAVRLTSDELLDEVGRSFQQHLSSESIIILYGDGAELLAERLRIRHYDTHLADFTYEHWEAAGYPAHRGFDP